MLVQSALSERALQHCMMVFSSVLLHEVGMEVLELLGDLLDLVLRGQDGGA